MLETRGFPAVAVFRLNLKVMTHVLVNDRFGIIDASDTERYSSSTPLRKPALSDVSGAYLTQKPCVNNGAHNPATLGSNTSHGCSIISV